MFDRTQFTFYESFYKAISRIKDKAERAETYDAICAYALYGTVPDLDSLPESSAIAFELIKPNLDASRRKAKGGQAKNKKVSDANDEDSGKMQQRCEEDSDKIRGTSSKDAANKKKKEKEKEKEIEIEKEVENECYIKGDATVSSPDPVSIVLADYLNRINPSASPSSLDELRSYAEDLGKDVCIRAFDIALDNKKTTWPYIRAILRDKLQRGVKCLADWDAMETEREKSKPGRKNEPQDYGDPEDFYK